MSKLVILRHGEKPSGKDSALELSPAGKARAQFLAEAYLGKGATKTPFGAAGPDVFFAITPHTIQTASPSAESWGLPVTAFCTTAKGSEKEAALDRRTQEAAARIRRALTKGKDVVAVWEHHRIADARIDPKTTLRSLLNLDRAGAPDTWPDHDYDTIWSFACDKDGAPAKLTALAQQFVPAPQKHKPGKAKKKARKTSRKKGSA